MEDKEKMKNFEHQRRSLDLVETSHKVTESKNLDLLQQTYDKQKKLNYRAMLDSQINVKNQL